MAPDRIAVRSAIAAHLETAFSSGGWAIVTWVAAVAAMRFTGADSTTWMIGLVGLTPLLMIPIYPILGMAVASRRRLMSVAAIVLALAHLAWTLPEWRAASAAPIPSRNDVTITVVTSNVFLGNPDVTDLGRELLELDTDVIVIQELTPWQVRLFAAAGLMGEYPYQILMPQRDATGSGMMSRLPFVDAGFRDIGGSMMPVATVDDHGVLVDVIGVHIQAPVFDSARRAWADQLRALADMVAGAQRPLILAGDFNATLQHDNLRAIDRAGSYDALLKRGMGWVSTWPRGRLYPPILRLDHIFATDDTAAVDAGVGTGTGSDHRPIWAEFIVGTAGAS